MNKKIRFSLLCSLCLLVAFLMHSGCIEDKCSTVRCENKGACVNGICTCPYGYEGNNCEELWMLKFLGEWSVSDSSRFDTTAKMYDINISSFRGLDTLLIKGFKGNMDTVLAVRKAYNKLNLLQRNIDTISSFQGGEVLINDNRITVTGLYSFKEKDAVITYYVTWAK